jgi:hypothetical protein
MRLAMSTGDLTEQLKKMLRALRSVQASNVEAERAFSSAGRFVTKIRNWLGDSTLNDYCFAHHKLKTDSSFFVRDKSNNAKFTVSYCFH